MHAIGVRLGVLGLMAVIADGAAAQNQLILEGGFLFGYDYIHLGDPPDYPGTLTFGNGPYAGAALQFGTPALFGRIGVGGFQTSNHAEASREVEIITTYLVEETVDLYSRFMWADVALGTTLGGGGTTLELRGGLRYLNALHVVDDVTVTTPPFIVPYIGALDEFSFNGIGPHVAAVLTVGNGPVRFFAGTGAAIEFGTSTLVRTLDFGGSVTSETFSGAAHVVSLDGEAGLIFGSGPLQFAIGYRASAFWNTHNGQAIYDVYPETSALAFQHGPFARLILPF